MMLSRRGLLGVFLAAPVVIRMPRLLMPIKSWSPEADRIEAMWRSGTAGHRRARDIRTRARCV